MSSTTAQNGTASPQSAGASIHSLIKDIRSTGQADVEPRALTTPFSLRVIQSTATWLAKRWGAAVAASGGATALIALITGVWVGIGTDPVGIAVVASAALVLAAVAISIAIIVRGDVVARVTGAAARHHAERAIASSALNNFSRFWFPGSFVRRAPDGACLPVADFEPASPNGVRQWTVTTRSGEKVIGPDIAAIVPASPPR